MASFLASQILHPKRVPPAHGRGARPPATSRALLPFLLPQCPREGAVGLTLKQNTART